MVHRSTEPAVFLQMPSLLSLFYLTPHVLQTRIIFNTNIELVLFSRTLLFSQTELVSSVSIVLPFTFQKCAYLSKFLLFMFLQTNWNSVSSLILGYMCVFTTHLSLDIFCYVLNCPLMCFILPAILNSNLEIG